MDNYFYLDSTGRQQGPVSADKLSALGVKGHTMVWKQGMAEWQRANSIENLRPFLYAEDTIRNPYARDERQATPPPYQGMSTGQPQQPQSAPMEKPDNYLAWAILSTIFCFWPTGIPAIVYSCQVNNYWCQGLYDKAYNASSKARFWSILTAVIAVAFWVFYLVIIFAIIGTGLSLSAAFVHAAHALPHIATSIFI